MAMEENGKLFSKFVRYCEKIVPDSEIILLLKKNFKRAAPTFIASDDFHHLLDATTKSIHNDISNKYVHIQNFVTELKAYRAKRPGKNAVLKSDAERKRLLDSDSDSLPDIKRPRRSDGEEAVGVNAETATPMCTDTVTSACTAVSSMPTCTSTSVTEVCTSSVSSHVELADTVHADSGNPVNAEVIAESAIDTPSTTHTDLTNDNTAEAVESSVQHRTERDTTVDHAEGPASHECEEKKKVVSEKQVQKLEQLLQDLNEEIKRLQEAEVTLEEMENESAYTLEGRYKQKFNKVWNKLCELKQRAPTTGRPIHRRFHYEGSRYSQINKRCERFVNKYKTFPDHSDIYDIVSGTNRKFQLRLGKNAVASLTREIFTEIGTSLQKRRQKDHIESGGCHLTDNFKAHKDPAIHDKQLQAKLDSNKTLGDSRLNQIYEKYERLQEMGDDGESEECDKDDHNEDDPSTDAVKCDDIRQSTHHTSSAADSMEAPPSDSHEATANTLENFTKTLKLTQLTIPSGENKESLQKSESLGAESAESVVDRINSVSPASAMTTEPTAESRCMHALTTNGKSSESVEKSELPEKSADGLTTAVNGVSTDHATSANTQPMEISPTKQPPHTNTYFNSPVQYTALGETLYMTVSDDNSTDDGEDSGKENEIVYYDLSDSSSSEEMCSTSARTTPCSEFEEGNGADGTKLAHRSHSTKGGDTLNVDYAAARSLPKKNVDRVLEKMADYATLNSPIVVDAYVRTDSPSLRIQNYRSLSTNIVVKCGDDRPAGNADSLPRTTGSTTSKSKPDINVPEVIELSDSD